MGHGCHLKNIFHVIHETRTESQKQCCHIGGFIANLSTFDTIWLPKFYLWLLVLFGYFDVDILDFYKCFDVDLLGFSKIWLLLLIPSGNTVYCGDKFGDFHFSPKYWRFFRLNIMIYCITNLAEHLLLHLQTGLQGLDIYNMESVQIIDSILIELLSNVCLQVTAAPGKECLFEYPPSKKLRMAKSTSNATEIQPKSIESKSHQFNNPIQESKSDPTRTPVNSAPATATRPKFDVARKLSELKADRDHWKHLCLSSRLQVTGLRFTHIFYKSYQMEKCQFEQTDGESNLG